MTAHNDKLIQMAALLREAIDLPPTDSSAVKAMAQDALDLIRVLHLEAVQLEIERDAWRAETLKFDQAVGKLAHARMWFSVLEQDGLGHTLTSNRALTNCPHCSEAIKVTIGIVQKAKGSVEVTFQSVSTADDGGQQ